MKKKNTNWQQWLVNGIFLLAGVACGLLIIRFFKATIPRDAPPWQRLLPLPLMYVLTYLALILQVVIHEAGHLVFGLISGYKFTSFRIGSFMLLKENGRLVLRRYSLAGTRGQCLMAPPELKNGRFPVVLSNLGGCIMNLVSSAVFFGVYLIVDRENYLSIFSQVSAVLGVVEALVNGIPMHIGTVNNDGYNACSIRKSSHAMYAFWCGLKENEQLAKGVRLRDMPEEWFSLPSDEEMKNSMVATQGVSVCNRLMDQHRFGEAEQLMARLLSIDSGIIGLHRRLMICDRMYCEMIRENRPQVLQQMYDAAQKKFMKSMGKNPSVIRTEYVYALLVEKNPLKADVCLALFEKISKTYPYPGTLLLDRELMELAGISGARCWQKNH